jgi:hypothetical protein
MAKLRALVDRGLKARGAQPRITNPQLKLSEKASAALIKAGIPVEEIAPTLTDVEYSLTQYLISLASAEQYPRLAMQTAELQRLARQAAMLSESLRCLSESSRRKILHAKDDLQHLAPAEPLALRASIGALASCAELAMKRMSKDRGGVPQNNDFANLLLGMTIAWRQHTPAMNGVTKSGDVYRGPLVDLVWTILRLEGIRIQSRQSLGRQLYRIRTHAARILAKKSAVTPVP